MNKRVIEVMQGRGENYILPFLWLHGAEEEMLRHCMEKIDNCGIKAVCLESRPHPDFAGPRWWHDLDILIDEAKKRNMRIWILDDSHFPTGYANGAAAQAPEHLKRWALTERVLPVDGPVKGCRFAVATRMGYTYIDKGQDIHSEPFREELVAVIAGRRIETDGKVQYTQLEDVTGQVTEEGWLQKDFPEGTYSLFTYTKRLGAAAGQNDYISMLEKDSVKILLDTVYEPHYQRYKEEFGKTIAGFFSDEPGFYNLPDTLYGLGRIGDDMPLPWTDDVTVKFKKQTADGRDLAMLPGLFHQLEGQERQACYAYMDIITKKYQANFSDQIGNWCREHEVEYIGHVLEDGLYSQNLGAGTGHYFRALHGQHMGGIDIVLNYLLPGRDYDNGIFTHYELPVLGASVAQQNVWMKGRSMCEIFGAFGWSEGLSLMKWMADHMMVNGINWFVPHAFTDKAFPDPDNPPQFYAQGNDPQYRYMHVLFHYMNRICHLFNGGQAAVDVAVFFPAEGSWMGKSRSPAYIGRMCLQHQIPYQILCMDNLKLAEVKGGRICIGNAAYRCLVVDSIEYLPAEYLEIFKNLIEKGACIRFVNVVPAGTDGSRMESWSAVMEEELLTLFHDYRICRPAAFSKWLRCYRYEQEDVTILMFANSSMTQEIDVAVTLPEAEKTIGYDALNDVMFVPDMQEDDRMYLQLDKGESFLLFMGKEADLTALSECGKEMKSCTVKMTWTDMEGEYRISLAPYYAQETFEPFGTKKVLDDVINWRKDFAGIIRYETTFTGKAEVLKLEHCYGPAEVCVNGQSCGVRIAYPYIFDISSCTSDGENRLRIEVATTLGEVLKDPMSLERAMEPVGILGTLKLGKRQSN
ncbi:MAG TPA: hypothetical protein GXX75_16485 [Clostridiales bacterium]|nr:hypothetical protein [Clostridiales bacterium]